MEKAEIKKDRLIFIINNEEDFYYSFGNRIDTLDLDNIEEFIKSLANKIKTVYIFITDNNIFIENFELNVQRASEAKSAALNMLLLNSVNNKDDITYRKVIVNKNDKNSFSAKIFYTYLKIDWLLNILKSNNLDSKIEGIFPLLQIFLNKKNFGYTLNGLYYTVIKDKDNIAIFNSLKNKNIEENIELKELNINELNDYLKSIDDKLELNFIDTGKFEIIDTLFLPILIILIIFNIIIFSFLYYQKSGLEKKLNTIKNQVKQELKTLEPYKQAEEKFNQINKVIDSVNKFKKSSFPFNELVKLLSKEKKIWIRQISLNYDNVIISGKAESAFKILELVKKTDFLSEAKITSKIIRDNNGFERFTIRAKFKNAFKE